MSVALTGDAWLSNGSAAFVRRWCGGDSALAKAGVAGRSRLPWWFQKGEGRACDDSRPFAALQQAQSLRLCTQEAQTTDYWRIFGQTPGARGLRPITHAARDARCIACRSTELVSRAPRRAVSWQQQVIRRAVCVMHGSHGRGQAGSAMRTRVPGVWSIQGMAKGVAVCCSEAWARTSPGQPCWRRSLVRRRRRGQCPLHAGRQAEGGDGASSVERRASHPRALTAACEHRNHDVGRAHGRCNHSGDTSDMVVSSRLSRATRSEALADGKFSPVLPKRRDESEVVATWPVRGRCDDWEGSRPDPVAATLPPAARTPPATYRRLPNDEAAS
ncbi:hypothetical protein OPT61_g8166 [Boeremia exigua]|uniref:Uncharacterized protein n=1 Tax=Boeremia exigua TaxID=749465 RepID=A0ACC2I0C4_9PLEO|nr:hypothetical protein OPT61_g8166 [Boeremia exigua]